MIDLENVAEFEIELQEAGPQGERGLSAYEVYLENGGTLSEIEWLESLRGETGATGPEGKQGEKGDPFTYEDFTEEQLKDLTGPQGPAGQDGTNGIDGKTPIKGTDYWTEEEQNIIKTDLKNYVDEQLGVVENAYY